MALRSPIGGGHLRPSDNFPGAVALPAEPIDRVHLVWDPALSAYDFGPGHPMQPVRVELAMALARAAGLLDQPALELVAPQEPRPEDLGRVHSAEHLAAIRAAGDDPASLDPSTALRFGLGPDTPPFRGMADAAAMVASASAEAARAVWEGRAVHAFAPAGGLHHASVERSSGFCVVNDCSVAIAALLDAGACRVAYVDVDVHHGDGTQWIHWDDPRVLTCSIHESGRFLFPGTGFVDELGGELAPGTAANVPMPPFASTADWLAALREAVVPLVEAFAPDVLVTQSGADSHHLDPLAHVETTMDVFPAMWAELHALAHRVCDGRWVATGGGGYQLYSVVPRAWAMLLAEMLDVVVDGPLPPAWLAEAEAAGGCGLPATWREDAVPAGARDRGSRAAAESARAITELRHALFPAWGLEP